MRIDAIILRELHMPLVRPFETSFGVTRDRRILLAEDSVRRPDRLGRMHRRRASVLLRRIDRHRLAGDRSTNLGRCWPPSRPSTAAIARGIFRAVRGNPMAKAALENAIWDLEAQREGISLSQPAGRRARQHSLRRLASAFSRRFPSCWPSSRRELAAGYQRIKLKCKPGWDVEVFERVRSRWPGIMLSCDANSAYRLRDADHLVSFDAFDLLMIEQPLWHDDFYFHSMLQKRLNTAICLDESIRNRRDALAAIEMESCRIINIKLGRVGGFSEAIAVHNAAQERGIPVWCGGMLESGIGRAHNIALSTLENFTLPGDVSASARYWAEDIIEPEVTVSRPGRNCDSRHSGPRLRSAHRPDRSPHRRARRPSAKWRSWHSCSFYLCARLQCNRGAHFLEDLSRRFSIRFFLPRIDRVSMGSPSAVSFRLRAAPLISSGADSCDKMQIWVTKTPVRGSRLPG